MLNRKAEAEKAIKFADEVAQALMNGTDENPVLAVLQKYRREDSLAVVPTEAHAVSQIYADMIAEYYVLSKDERELTEDELAQLDHAYKAAFDNLLTGDYQKYRRGVYSTLTAYLRLRDALKAYELLKSGSKSKDAPDAEPSAEQIRQAVDSVRKSLKKQRMMTFDVMDNMIAPLERYARARSVLMPEGELADSAKEWRIPVDVCLNAASAAEAALLAILYYRHRPEKPEKYTDYYPVFLRDVGIYIANQNQGEAVKALIDAPVPEMYDTDADFSAPEPEQVGADLLTDILHPAEDASSTASAKKPNKRIKAVYLKFHQIPFPGNHTQTMVAIKQEAVEKFVVCNKKGADKGTYITVTGEKPRELLHSVEHLRMALELYEDYMLTVYDRNNDSTWADWISSNGEFVQKILRHRLQSEFKDSDLKSEGFKNLKMYTRSSAKWVLKFMLAAHWLQLSDAERGKPQTVTLDDLTALLSGNPDEVFNKLEDVKWDAFNAAAALSPEAAAACSRNSASLRLKFDVNGAGPGNRTLTYSGKY